MKNRPIFVIAMALAMVITVIYFFTSGTMGKDPGFSDGETVLLTGKIYKYEKRSENINIYVDCTECLSSDKSDFNRYNGKALISMPSKDFEEKGIRIGNLISAECTYKEFRKARNYGNYDEKLYYHSMGIYVKAEIKRIDIMDRKQDIFRQLMHDIGESMSDSIYSAVEDENTAGILAAICTGDKSGLTSESKRLYQQSGIAHILAISGLHISVLGMTFFRILRKRFRFVFSAIVSVLLMAGFCIMSNSSPSAVRATIMFTVHILAIGLGKSVDMICSVSLSAVLLLISVPELLFNTGFQLSYAAILSVGILYESLRKFLKVKNKFLSGFLMSLCITAATIPVTASVYYEIPLYSILFNLLILPLMSLVLSTGIISAVLGLFSLLLGRFFSGLGVYIVKFINMICEFNRNLPLNRWVTGYPGKWRIIIYYLLMIVFVTAVNIYCRNVQEKASVNHSGKKQKKKKRKRVLISSVFFLLLLFLLFDKSKKGLSLYFIDVGQGECILMINNTGKAYLVDGGSVSEKEAAEYRIQGALKYQGVSDIEYVIITHPDQDHISGILDLMKNDREYGIRIHNILLPYVPENDNYQGILQQAAAQGIKVVNINRGMRLEDGELTITCLHPDKSFSSEESNEYSAVLDIRYGKFSALLSGDLGFEGEKSVMKSSGQTKPQNGYNLLKIAHHGSKNSSSEEFLDWASADIAVISAGVNNVYGHPSRETLERIGNAGTERVYCTKDCGEIIIETDGISKISLSHVLG